MKKILIFCMLCWLTIGFMQGQEKQAKNIFGVSAGIAPAILEMYFGEPFDFYPNRELSPLCQLFYARQIHPLFRIGAYLELEKVRFSDQTGTDFHSFRRNNMGLNGLLQFPKKPLHMQLGGYVGYGYLRANNWNDLTGLDLGGFAGPAYEKGKIGYALHFQTGYANYTASGTPSKVILYNPKILIKVYRKF